MAIEMLRSPALASLTRRLSPVVHTPAGAHFGTFQDISAIRGEVRKSPENRALLAFSGKWKNRV
jgi:hypothetical protein